MVVIALLVVFASAVQDRKLLQINSSATTVDAAPLVAANASSSVAGSDSSSSKNDTKPRAILSDVVSAYKSKFKPFKANTIAPSMPDSSATATANASADGDINYYSTPCSSGPSPSQYEAFVECICSCPVAYANGPSSAPTMAPMMDPMTDGMADAMDSDADANPSTSSSGSGCAPEPVPTHASAHAPHPSHMDLRQHPVLPCHQ
ncbi:hypothetical protein WJX77_010042 [Trebouxia sp. C0004]